MFCKLDYNNLKLLENYFFAASAALIGANALVSENMAIPDGSLVMGTPARIKRQLGPEQQKALELQEQHYFRNGRRFGEGLLEDSGQ